MSRITEEEIGMAVLDILAHSPKGEATVRQIIKEVPKHVRLTGSDKMDSLTREGEELWEQQVRNLKSHEKVPGNIFHDGLVEQAFRGVWRITSNGQKNTQKVA